MLAQCFRGVYKDDSLLGDDVLDVGVGGFAVELSFDAREKLPLLFRNAETFKGPLDILRHLFPGAFRFLSLRKVVTNLVEIDVFEILGGPMGGHRLRVKRLERGESEVEQPAGLLLDRTDVADGVLAQTTAGIECVLDVVGEVTNGLVDADRRIFYRGFDRLGFEFGGRIHGLKVQGAGRRRL
jgi:hypothetical protein